MVVNGRKLRPSNLAERRLLLSFGVDHIRVPREHNPYAIARKVQRLAQGGEDMKLLRTLAERSITIPFPHPVPLLPDEFPMAEAHVAAQ